MIVAEQKYDLQQPRDSIGRWADVNGDDGSIVPGTFIELVSGYSFGTLVADYMTGYGRRCIYQFDFGAISVPGGTFPCGRRVPSSAVSHGHFLNDNWRR